MAFAAHARAERGVHDRRARRLSARRPRAYHRAHLRGAGCDGPRALRAGGGDEEGERSALVPTAAVVLLRVRGVLQLRPVPERAARRAVRRGVRGRGRVRTTKRGQSDVRERFIETARAPRLDQLPGMDPRMRPLRPVAAQRPVPVPVRAVRLDAHDHRRGDRAEQLLGGKRVGGPDLVRVPGGNRLLQRRRGVPGGDDLRPNAVNKALAEEDVGGVLRRRRGDHDGRAVRGGVAPAIPVAHVSQRIRAELHRRAGPRESRARRVRSGRRLRAARGRFVNRRVVGGRRVRVDASERFRRAFHDDRGLVLFLRLR
mmetsp:Transcript_8769/g.37047  ORF Transcript_8769/g.37047 Transcript_8769/m.37047 type:complete len:314 (+) Transcript_8769:212-1153(+)